MKDILLVAATHKEVSPITGKTNSDFIELSDKIDVLITGVGVLPTAYKLTKVFAANSYKLALNAGIAGSTGKFKPGDVLEVTSDTLITAGKYVKNKYRSMFDVGLWSSNEFPYLDGIIVNKKHFADLPGAKGITTSIIGFNKNPFDDYKPEVETMEGAAFFFVCHSENVNCAAVRSISNFVNDDDWYFDLSIENLNNYLKSKFEL